MSEPREIELGDTVHDRELGECKVVGMTYLGGSDILVGATIAQKKGPREVYRPIRRLKQEVRLSS